MVLYFYVYYLHYCIFLCKMYYFFLFEGSRLIPLMAGEADIIWFRYSLFVKIFPSFQLVRNVLPEKIKT